MATVNKDNKFGMLLFCCNDKHLVVYTYKGRYLISFQFTALLTDTDTSLLLLNLFLLSERLVISVSFVFLQRIGSPS